MFCLNSQYILTALLFSLCASFARDAIYNLALAENSVEIEVAGSVKAYCSSSGPNTHLNVRDASVAGVSTAAFIVDCNAPFQYSMVSAYGAMRLVDAWPQELHAKIPYKVHIRIPLARGSIIEKICTSESLLAGSVTCDFTNSGTKIAIAQRAEAQISWAAPNQSLFAGQYSDHIKISVNIKP